MTLRSTPAEPSQLLQRNAAKPKDLKRAVPKSFIILVYINREPVRALLDSGSLSDFMSTTLADQLKLKLQLTVLGSRTVINYGTSVDFKYQDINERRTFNIINLDSYDLILRTLFLFQHKILMGFNPYQLAVGSKNTLQIVGDEVAHMSSRMVDLLEEDLQKLQEELYPIETPLPPLRAINHTIPLINEAKVYCWQPSKCPEALRLLWRKKREAYLATGRWKFMTGTNAMPMLMLKKLNQKDIDDRECNANTVKKASPLPDIDTILRNIVAHPY
ncbi:hypothetical protein K439DRAFT_1648493 [Ramaria rubella]|nr:hypothetical protein K439DRAFT_1648493 [Ramaria rubella]